MRFAVLSSSRGTTFQAVLDRVADGTLQAECLGLISDSADHGCREKAKAAGVPTRIVEKKDDESREEYDKRVHEALLELGVEPGVDVVATLGWMFILSPWFIAEWPGRIINVHPALLPKYGGKGMYGMHVHEAVLAAGEAESGMTIHIVDDGVDTGPILLQKTCTVDASETPESLQAKVQELEKEWYPKVLQMIETGEVVLP